MMRKETMIGRRLSAATAAIAAAVPLLAPGVANAQPVPGPISRDVPFHTLSKSALGGPIRAKQAVIRSAAELAAFFDGNAPSLPPTEPRVDWNREVVLGVALGGVPTGGYGIEITKVTHMIGGITGGMAMVHYAGKSPNGPAIQIPTKPYHLVRLDELAARFVFVNDAAAETAREVTGIVRVNGGKTTIVENRSSILEVTNIPFS